MKIFGKAARNKAKKAFKAIVYFILRPYSRFIKRKKIAWLSKTKKKIKVGFVVTEKSMWKLDSLFWRMYYDSNFSPLLVVCPTIRNNTEKSVSGVIGDVECFREQNYPVCSTYDEGDKRWRKLKECDIDILFFSFPYKNTINLYYESAFINFPSFYIPYYSMCTKNVAPDRMVYGNTFLSFMDRVYLPHKYAKKKYDESAIKKNNSMVVGYPFFEQLHDKKEQKIKSDAWKKNEEKVKIIYAPHHTIENGISTFMENCEYMREMAREFKFQVQWSFKPHPHLKRKLEMHPLWGREKVQEYWAFWADSEYTQVDEEAYIDLFLGSDAMIHDCNSFVSEYALLNKPALFLSGGKEVCDYFNDFGVMALERHEIAKNKCDIRSFIEKVVCGSIAIDANGDFCDYINESIIKKKPSLVVMHDMKKMFSRL